MYVFMRAPKKFKVTTFISRVACGKHALGIRGTGLKNNPASDNDDNEPEMTTYKMEIIDSLPPHR